MRILKELIELFDGNVYASRTSEAVSCRLRDNGDDARTVKFSMRTC
jgi:hypothetical protein